MSASRPPTTLQVLAVHRQPGITLLRFLEANQCPRCLGWTEGARKIAGRVAGQRARIRRCVCDGHAAPTGQASLDFGGAA